MENGKSKKREKKGGDELFNIPFQVKKENEVVKGLRFEEGLK